MAAMVVRAEGFGGRMVREGSRPRLRPSPEGATPGRQRMDQRGDSG